MSDPYERVKGGRLTFKDGTLATRAKSIDKKKHKKKKSKIADDVTAAAVTTVLNGDEAAAIDGDASESAASAVVAGGESAYTIDPMKRMKYEQLFPVEAKKFRYDPINVDYNAKTVEDALDDRVKKKADRYCK